MASINNLIQAVINVMDECKGVDKSLVVGKGDNSYKGVSAKDVFLKVSQSMVKNGICIFPIDIEENTEFQEFIDSYGKKKQRFFTRVKVKYEICHTSGESKVVVALGHGADALDKASGKALTYAQKTYLLYQFLIATGHIDDTDNQHSDQLSNETQKPNGFRDNRIDPYAHGDELVNQVYKLIFGIHNSAGLGGESPSIDYLKTLSINDLGAKFTEYKTIESRFNYYSWVKKKLNDPSEVWNLNRLKLLKQKCIDDRQFTPEVEAILDAKVFEVSN